VNCLQRQVGSRHLVSMVASSTSWKREPFTSGRPIPYRPVWGAAQFRLVTQGVIPKSMEDKWFIYYEEPHLFLHRSWTGAPAYRLTVVPVMSGYQVTETLAAMKLTPESDLNPAHEADLLDFLISNLLLGDAKPFPLPPNADEKKYPGVLQHVISGTGYPQRSYPPKKPWWRFW